MGISSRWARVASAWDTWAAVESCSDACEGADEGAGEPPGNLPPSAPVGIKPVGFSVIPWTCPSS